MRNHNRYESHVGPPRAIRNLDEWTQRGGHHDRELDAACDERDAATERRRATVLDVYDVADRVLSPLLGQELTAVPRRLRQDVDERLASRGVKRPTKQQRMDEARRLLAGDRAAADMETSLAITLAAALLWEPIGGWKAHAPRRPRKDGFSSVGALLAAAFGDVALGTGPTSLDVAQNRARTHSIGNEIYVQASRSATGNARNHAALDRQIDARAILFRSSVDMSLLPLLFEVHVLKRHPSRAEVIDAMRAREARKLRRMLPCAPKAPSATELDAWRLACGIVLWGEADGDGDQVQHNRKRENALMRSVREAEDALRAAIGHKPKADSKPPAEARVPIEPIRPRPRFHGSDEVAR